VEGFEIRALEQVGRGGQVLLFTDVAIAVRVDVVERLVQRYRHRGRLALTHHAVTVDVHLLEAQVGDVHGGGPVLALVDPAALVGVEAVEVLLETGYLTGFLAADHAVAVRVVLAVGGGQGVFHLPYGLAAGKDRKSRDEEHRMLHGALLGEIRVPPGRTRRARVAFGTKQYPCHGPGVARRMPHAERGSRDCNFYSALTPGSSRRIIVGRHRTA